MATLPKFNEMSVIYNLDDRPPIWQTLFAALQHLMAIFVGIITPTIVICGALGITEDIPYLISMSLIVSGVATFIQVYRIGPIGSGLLSIQGTSFAFLGSILSVGFHAKSQGADSTHILSLIFGVCFVGAFIEIILSRFLHRLRRVITPTVTGIVVTLIGLSLVRVAFTDIGGGAWLRKHQPDQFGSWTNLALGGLVFLLIILFNRSKKPLIRMAAIVIGLIVGYIITASMGMIDFAPIAKLPLLTVPVPFKYGFSFSPSAFIPVALIYVITTIESIGDLTATSLVSGEPVSGDLYMKRIKGGVLGDGFNSLLAATFNTFPNTTFSQNNGVIQLTGIASRYVGYFIALFLFILGLFPVIGGIFQVMPPMILGGATLVMFGTVAAAGIKIIASVPIGRREMLIMAIAYGLGFGVLLVPDILAHAPGNIQNIFSSPITTGGLAAIIANIILPRAPTT
ncbi:MAG: purine permease [Spartobacteria bacterium]|nr:purine permease [Spartobacteria bacterium]